MVNIEIDGIPLTVDPSKMVIQVADEAGIDIPRFCYHKKLSIAANCRMCLVEVEQSRKALPACATPVTEGMKIFTQSEAALAAQKGVMEFLLINHPLDCPICDQAGECELQDMSMGYGGGLGRFTEGKRVVIDKNIGPLIQTEMTRCIHCTRCVRFGTEIAGIAELGATGRGEHMEIGTYVESSLVSELSGNIIDLCPVGALTSKPFRYRARAWELAAHPSIAPHDAVGSNIEFHTRRSEVMRVVPRDNDNVNEIWISDRDRFSYLGLEHEQRATVPMVKQNGKWQQTDWETALQAAMDGLQTVKAQHGTEQMAGVISPTATLEESYLFQSLLTGLEIYNTDYRLRQQDFADENAAYSSKDWCLAHINESDDVILIGCNIRAEQPIIAHRIRQAAMIGTTVTDINFFKSDLLMSTATQLTLNIEGMLSHLQGIAKALMPLAGKCGKDWQDMLENVVPTAVDQTIAMRLSNAVKATIFVGALANNHPQAAKIRTLANMIARLGKGQLLILPTANSNAAQLVANMGEQGLNVPQIWQNNLRSYVLFGVEPELDCADPVAAQQALQQADFVISMNSYVTDEILAYAKVILPIASFAETSGTFIGVDGQWQSFKGAVSAKGESRPGWKVLRVLGNLAQLKGFDYVSSQDIRDEVQDKLKLVSANTRTYLPDDFDIDIGGLMTISEVPAYQIDSIVRRSDALQKTPENQQASIARMNAAEANKQGVSDVEFIKIRQGEHVITMTFEVDDAIADGCLYLVAGTPETINLGAAFSSVKVSVGTSS
ncbi:MAG: NADH-quinone oxidoreductase subunit G [Methylophaga sp.]|nr:MAG: NADH-quinone oxidoreductase subunit G [Methylophaga sp.]